MKTLVERLVAEANALKPEDMSEKDAPSVKIQRGERRLKDGIVPEEARKFYFLAALKVRTNDPLIEATQEEADQLRLQGLLTPEKKGELQNRLSRLRLESDTARKILGVAISDAIPEILICRRSIEIREGWQVVEAADEEEDERSPLEGFARFMVLASMLGAGSRPDCSCADCQARRARR